jgi:dTDP-4-amino-4,6-dideoxygalactose transaminase
MSEKLAIDGGKPINRKSFPMWPSFQKSTIQAAMEPLKTGKVNYWTGTRGMEFEKKFAKWVGARYCISTTNGTSALHTALAGLGIGPGDEVICTSYSFIASSFCILQAGAIPVFADVRRETHTIDPADIERKISNRTRGIVVVHLYGQICDMDPIMEIAKRHKLVVVEDCAQAHGGIYRGRKVGTIGHANAFSFCQSKHFTTGGEGGAITTNDENVAWICRSFRDHGYDVQERLRLLEMEAKLPYIHNMVGFNYRMTEIQSIIGLCELKRLDSWNLKNRRRNGEYLLKAFQGIPEMLYLPEHNREKVNAFWWFPIVMDVDRLKVDIKTFWHAIAAEGVPCGPVQWPQMYKERAYREHNGFGRNKFPFRSKEYTRPEAVEYQKTLCPNAAWLEERTFWLPTHPVYDLSHMKLLEKSVKKVIAAYRR